MLKVSRIGAWDFPTQHLKAVKVLITHIYSVSAEACLSGEIRPLQKNSTSLYFYEITHIRVIDMWKIAPVMDSKTKFSYAYGHSSLFRAPQQCVTDCTSRHVHRDWTASAQNDKTSCVCEHGLNWHGHCGQNPGKWAHRDPIIPLSLTPHGKYSRNAVLLERLSTCTALMEKHGRFSACSDTFANNHSPKRDSSFVGVWIWGRLIILITRWKLTNVLYRRDNVQSGLYHKINLDTKQ